MALSSEWRTTPPNNGTPYGPVDATHNPIAESPGRIPGNPTVTAAVAIGAAQVINVTNFPAERSRFRFRLVRRPGIYLRVTKVGTAGSPWTVTAAARPTTTTFTDCSAPVKPAAAVNAATVSIRPPRQHESGDLTANWTSANWATTRSTITLTAGSNAAFQRQICSQ